MSQPFTTLIDAAGLGVLIAEGGDLVVADLGFDLADPAAGERRFAESHVAGAIYVHLDRDLCAAKTGRNGRHPLPDRADFRATVGRLGIGAETQVVALDGQGGMFAARFWWMLRWIGHEAAAVLDGGTAAWREHGGALASGVAVAKPARAPYPERPPLVKAVDADTVAARGPERTLLDARAAERFRGEVEPIDAVAGHIPGAIDRFHKSNQDERGRFKTAQALRAEFATLLGDRRPADVIHSCGSGVTACHNLLAMEHAGLHGSALYPGSWSEWSADPARPVARGD